MARAATGSGLATRASRRALPTAVWSWLALAAWTAQGGPASAATFEEIKQVGKLHVAVYRDFAPFADDGKGIDVDVAKALAARMGLAAEVKGYPDADSVDGDLRNIVWRGHPLWRERLADVMMHVPVDEHLKSKNEQVAILAPYFRERLVVARNKNRIPQLPTLQVFSREKIGVQAETLEDRYLVSSFGGLLRENVVHFKNMLDAALALRKNELPAVMGRQTIIEAGLGEESGRYEIGPVATPGMAISGWDLGVAVKADNPELAAAVDKAMAELRRDGSIERIFTSRGLTYRAPVAK
ncbi:MAG TPA: transporter substrate-binding domain-containing protein [Anaeromyxobacteraceae bacterium]|nr:transporter substrate-binding domain-containing protein [Anaeromyxobacteraceae bacterium]